MGKHLYYKSGKDFIRLTTTFVGDIILGNQYKQRGIYMKKLISLVTALIIICGLFTACGNASVKGNTLSFTNRVKDMQKLDGQEVTITGYMSTLETDKNNYFYLVSSPYNNKPFSDDHSKKLSDTIAVFTKSGEDFDQTDSLITVKGILSFGSFKDSMGYSYTYLIKDAVITPATEDALSGNEKKWQKLSQAGIIERTDDMMRFLEYVCSWPTLTISSKNGDSYLTPELTLYNLEGASALFGYGCEEGYFDKIIEDIKAVSDKDYKELVKIIEAADELSARALSALNNKEYTLQDEYSGTFGDGRKQYALNDSKSISSDFTALAEDYNKWLDSWKV